MGYSGTSTTLDISVVSLCLFSEQKLSVSIETSSACMFDLSTSLAHSSRKVKVYSVTESHLVSFLQNSQPCWVLLAPAASSALPLLGLFSNQINPSPFSTRHKHSCKSLVSALSHPLKKINEVFHLLFFSIWNYFIIDRYIVCFCEHAVLPKAIFVYLFMHLL